MPILERIWDALGILFGGLFGSFDRLFTSLFGSANARQVGKLQQRADRITALEPKYKAMSDEELREQTTLLRKRLRDGETLDDILEEAFAVCREGSVRHLGMRHYEKMVEGLGGYGELVERDEDIVPAIGRAMDSGKPACINVMIEGAPAPDLG